MNAPQRNFEAKEWRLAPVPAYAVSDRGDVCRIGNPRDLKPCPQKRGGYLAVHLWSGNKSKLWPVHQLVAIGFHGPRPTARHHAAHFDGNKLNNTPENVRWATKEENEAHKKLHGTANIGDRNGSAKLTAADVRAIRAAFESGTSRREIERQFRVEQSHLSRILSRELWSHV